MNCINCNNPIPESGSSLCGPCYDEVPRVFTCCQCGQQCFKSANKFGQYVPGLTADDDAEIMCSDCTNDGYEWTEELMDEMI